MKMIIVLSTAANWRTCVTLQGIGFKLSDYDTRVSKHVAV